jgi:hypothetical protein
LALAGLVDFRGVPVRLLEEAARRGTMAHAAIAALLRGESARHEPDVAGYVRAYERFEEDTGFVPELVEHPIVNARYRYAGRLDVAGKLNGRLAVIDFKCSASAPPWVPLQLVGYQLGLGDAWRDSRRYALLLQPDATYKLVHFASPTDVADFLACVRIAHFQLRHGGISL